MNTVIRERISNVAAAIMLVPVICAGVGAAGFLIWVAFTSIMEGGWQALGTIGFIVWLGACITWMILE